MSPTALAVFGIASGAVNTIGLLPYLIDIFKRKTKPERASWWVWFALSAVALGAQIAAGSKWSLLLTISATVNVGIIAVLSIPFGYGKFHLRDTLSLVAAGFGIILSLILSSPLLAVITVILVDSGRSLADRTEVLESSAYRNPDIVGSSVRGRDFKLPSGRQLLLRSFSLPVVLTTSLRSNHRHDFLQAHKSYTLTARFLIKI